MLQIMQQPKPNLPPPQPINIFDDYDVRRQLSRTLMGFCGQFLPHYLSLPRANFHDELFLLFEDWSIKFLSIIGFRGSAKSSIGSLALPLWAALNGKAQFIILFSDTAAQAKLNISNIRHELENNDLLIADFGDQSEGISKQVEWTQNSILFKNGARIMARSRGQRIRGLRHRQFRPDLVIIDDPEEREKVQKKEYRDKTEQWLRGDVIPAIEESKARLLVIGNTLHTDALMARLKNDPIFEHREYPLIDSGGQCTWRAKYPTEADIKNQEQKVGRTAFLREYLLKVVPPEGQEVKEEWLQFYDDLPPAITKSGVGVDYAISKKETADFTSMVSGVASIIEGRPKIFILPKPINERLSFHETIQQKKSLMQAMKIYSMPMFYGEDVAYQRAAIEEAQRQMIPMKAMRVGMDKRARLRTVATFIQNGTVLFPRKGAEDLLDQIVNFGITDHDDLCDAFCFLIFGLIEEGVENPEVILLG